MSLNIPLPSILSDENTNLISTIISSVQEISRRAVDGTTLPLFVDYSNYRVGIGTINATSATLVVSGTMTLSSTLTIGGAVTSTGIFNALSTGNIYSALNVTGATQFFGNVSASNVTAASLSITSTANLFSALNVTGTTYHIGNVGIGVPVPLATLHVGTATGALVGTNIQVINNQTGSAGLGCHNSTNGVETVMFAETTGAGSVGTTSAHEFKLFTNNAEKARITTAGNFGINNSAPTQILDVGGTAQASGLIVGNTGLDVAGAWQNWTPAFTGFSVNPGSITARYIKLGRWVTVKFLSGNGTSNATTFTITLPVAAREAVEIGMGQATDNGVTLTAPGMILTRVGSTTADVYKDLTAAAWTNTGGKTCSFTMTYEASAA